MLANFNFRAILDYLPVFAEGFWATLYLSAISFICAVAMGVLICAMLLHKSSVLNRIARIYIDVIRSTPLLVQLYFLYFGLPRLGLLLPEYLVGIIALTINSGAYIAEIVRAGIQSVPTGQVEAATAFGMRYVLAMRLIILPQAFKVTVPPLLGQAVVLVKDSALLSLISVVELTRAGQLLASDRFMPAEGYLATAVGYLVLYYCLKGLAAAYERRMRYEVKTVAREAA